MLPGKAPLYHGAKTFLFVFLVDDHPIDLEDIPSLKLTAKAPEIGWLSQKIHG